MLFASMATVVPPHKGESPSTRKALKEFSFQRILGREPLTGILRVSLLTASSLYLQRFGRSNSSESLQKCACSSLFAAVHRLLAKCEGRFIFC